MTLHDHKHNLRSTTSSSADAGTERRQELAKLLPLWPSQIDDVSIAGRQRIVRLLARALREERCRGRGGHWAYDLTRHAALSHHHRRELELLEAELRRCKRRRDRAES